jgi:protocatechuate 3,4-dioxygenase beta subunit
MLRARRIAQGLQRNRPDLALTSTGLTSLLSSTILTWRLEADRIMNSPHQHDLGLAHDLPRLISRRRALGLFAGGLGAAAVAACGSSEGDGAGAATTRKATAEEIPEETAGPFPGDGSNGPNALTESGVVRRDITKSFGDASGSAEGVPASIEMTLLDVGAGGTPLAGAAVYVWHCDREGRYSMYDEEVASENYLRGVQESGRDGKVVFDSIFPAAYSGRWPHVHFEVYESLDAATSAGSKLHTSQIALPQDACDAVYATAGYEGSVATMEQTSLDTDMVFSDGYRSQLASWSGSPREGIAVRLNVGV